MSKGDVGVGISVEDAVSELSLEVESAVNFLSSEFGDDWERAERYFAGGTDMGDVEGRSKVVKTEVRDVIRALKPSIMRTLLHARKPVEYIPSTIFGAELAEQQALYATQLFWAQGGYKMLLSAIDESMKKKAGPVKCYWESDPVPEFIKVTGVTAADYEMIQNAPDCEIIEVEDDTSPHGGDVQTFEIEFYKYHQNGKVRMEAFPIIEFFINRNATCTDDADVHGHRRDVTVAEALALGLEYDYWSSLDADDPEQNEYQGESHARRGYQKNSTDDLQSDDLLNHKFLLTECYCSYDLKGVGFPQRYVFWLGGTSYKYLDHEEIDDYCIDLVEVDPVPFAPLGRSIADLTMNEQDLNTSILRAITDNFHIANNPRPYANPMLVDFNDLMNNAIGAPIKVKPGGEVGTYDIPFTGQQGLPLLQYLEQDVQNKVGVTKASQGLDPDAMQSTDAEAVKNTIMLAQGQVELIVRNIIETGLIPLFKRLLKLSIRHMDKLQVVRTKGMVIPIDTAIIDPELIAEPNVGIGTASPDEKAQGLLFFLQKQEQYLGEYGLDNPLVSLSNLYNTLEDLAEVTGFHDVGRYFKLVTPEIEAQLAKQRAEQAKQQAEQQQNNVPMDPSKALMAIEGGKARVKQMEVMADRERHASQLELDAIMAQEEADLKRDKLTQDRVLDLLKVKESARTNEANIAIKQEQNRNNKLSVANARSRNADREGTSGSQEVSENTS